MDTQTPKPGIQNPHPGIRGCGYDYGLCGSDAVAHALHSLAIGNSLEETFLIADHHLKGDQIHRRVRVWIEKSRDPAFDRFHYTDSTGSSALSGGPATPLGISEGVAHLMRLLHDQAREFSATIYRRKFL